MKKLISFLPFSVLTLSLALVIINRPAPDRASTLEERISRFSPQVATQLAASARFTSTQDRVAGTSFSLTGRRAEALNLVEPKGLTSVMHQQWAAFAQQQKDAAVCPTFPTRYSDGAIVKSFGMEIALRPLGSTPTEAQVENGKVVYHDAFPHTDSLQISQGARCEEFLLLRDKSAPTRFEYEIAATSGVSKIDLHGNALHFTNARGQDLQLKAPWLIDSTGRQVTNALRWEVTARTASQATSRVALVVDNSSLSYPVLVDPLWIAGNPMLTPRYGHTLTLLTNGKVLAAGGASTIQLGTGHGWLPLEDALASAELYDPATGVWTPTGSLHTSRAGATGTLLLNGKVLVAGGASAGNALATAELYDPVTGTWTVTGKLHTARDYGTANRLLNGKVLVSGGYNASNAATNTAEVFNPATNTWTATGLMTNARRDGATVVIDPGEHVSQVFNDPLEE